MNLRRELVIAGWVMLAACGGESKKPSEFPEPIPPDPVPEVPAASAEPAGSGGAPAGDAPADAKSAATAKPDAGKAKSLGAITTDGGITEDAVTQTVTGVAAGTDSCHEAYLQKSPQGAGDMTVTVTLAKGGKVKNVAVKSKAVKDKTVTRCLSQAFKSATWPAPTGKKAKISFAWSIAAKS